MNRRSYQDKVVIVAGGASGIGEQLVRQLAAYTTHIVVLDNNAKAGTSLANELPAIEFNQVDFINADLVKRTARHLVKKYGGIDYFFNCAGTFMGGEIRDTPIEDWNRISVSNLSPIWNGTSVFYAAMQKQGYGHIVNIASAAGLFSVPAMSIYGATKAAVVSLTLGLRSEAKTLGIKATVVCPTIVKTPLYETALYPGADRQKILNMINTYKQFQTPNVTAARILRGVSKNKAIVQTAASTHVSWVFFKTSPQLYAFFAARFLRLYRKSLRKQI